jgi:hypothetical protein
MSRADQNRAGSIHRASSSESSRSPVNLLSLVRSSSLVLPAVLMLVVVAVKRIREPRILDELLRFTATRGSLLASH